jgi:hypothetical protein
MISAGYVESMGEKGCAHRVLVGKPVGKRQLRRPRHKWEDNIKVGHQVVVWGRNGVIWLRIGTGGGFLCLW